VRAPEFPGLGHAPPEKAPTIDGVADRVATAIRAMPGRRAVVCGLSMGGYVALSLAVRQPRDGPPAALVLASTRAEADDDASRAARNAGIARIRGGDLEGYLDELVPRLLAADAPAELLARVREIAAGQSPEAVAAALGALRDRRDRSGDLAAISVPALILWGAADRITPRPAAQALAAGIPAARLEVIGGAGHLLALEQPEAVAAALRSVADQ
jgi:pimeloyl-ACP methyl ester carboxylesterase